MLSKIKELPEDKRKIIFWAVMIVLALTLSGLYVKYIQKNIVSISMDKTKEELQVHSLEEILNKIQEIEIPKIEIPKIDQQSLRELERIMEETSKETPEETLIENNHKELLE